MNIERMNVEVWRVYREADVIDQDVSFELQAKHQIMNLPAIQLSRGIARMLRSDIINLGVKFRNNS